MLATIRPYNPGGHEAVNVCTEVVKKDLCVGCGICVPVCPTGTLQMVWNDYGEYIPVDRGDCRKGCHVCVDACPFLDHNEDEDTLARTAFGDLPGIQHTVETGYYLAAYAGYSKVFNYRANGASGGLAKWFLASVLERRIADRVLCVTSGNDHDQLFQYAVFDSPADVRGAAKSSYYPVEMSSVIETVLKEEARYAIIGLPCFLKGLKLAMMQNVRLRKRIILTAGLVCGQMKTRGFAEYLARKVSLTPKDLVRISFREKDYSQRASNFSFHAATKSSQGSIRWSDGYKEPWVTGQFKPRCCNFCDDTFAEVADVAFMDAWLPKYVKDGRGTSIVLTRSLVAKAVIKLGIERDEVHVEPISIEDVISSQDGVVAEKREMLPFRLWLSDRNQESRPRKRVPPRKPPLDTRLHLWALQQLRVASHEAMRIQRATSPTGLEVYTARTRMALLFLRFSKSLWRKGQWWRQGPIWPRAIRFFKRQAVMLADRRRVV